MKIIIDSPWHIWQSGILTLRNIVGQKVCNQFFESVIVVREYWKMRESQQKTLMSESVTRHVWEKCPLSGHSVLFMTRAWELGRMAAYIKKNSSVEEQRAFQDKVRYSKEVGWLRDIPEPYIHVLDDSPESSERSRTEKEEYKKDKVSFKCFNCFLKELKTCSWDD